jgi:hypothetical protein
MMALRVRSVRYANRKLRVGQLLVVFRGEHADLPGHAHREYAFLVTRVPGVFAEPVEPVALPETVAGTGEPGAGVEEPPVAPVEAPVASNEGSSEPDPAPTGGRRDRRRGR